MTPLQCLDARARLGWSRQDLADACGLAVQIIRLYEAGALEGFDDCEAAIAEALYTAEAARLAPLAIAPKSVPKSGSASHRGPRRGGALVWLLEARRRWGLSEDGAKEAWAP
jgi:transcriptional regulator with XRE-family HTH domain